VLFKPVQGNTSRRLAVMSHKKYSLVLIFMCFTFFISASPIHSSDSERARLSLKGLQGIPVLIEELPSAFQEAGLTEYQVQTDVELKLRRAGIKVLSATDDADAPGNPSLYIQIWGVKSKNLPDAFSVSFEIQLQQKVFLSRSPDLILWAPTWSLSSWGLILETSFTQRVREKIKDLTDKFINAYLSVNPKGGK